MTATICRTCDGTGRVFLPAHPVPNLPCQTCRGTGCTHPDHLDAVYNAVRCFGCQGAADSGSSDDE